jgi:copper chaperone CopZ
MQIEKFTVQNVKCGGCVSAIQQGLKELSGIEQVDVVIEGGKLTVQGEGFSRQQIADKLVELGYPEA